MFLNPAYAVQPCNYNKGNNDKYIGKKILSEGDTALDHVLRNRTDPEQTELTSKLNLL